MPTYYTGDDSAFALNVAATIVGATNASPIVLTTAAPHLFSTGDRTHVASVVGNTAANSSPNAPWVIQVVDATHFQLVGSTGNGVWTSGGVAYDLDLAIPISLPIDGEPSNASSFNIAYEGLADRSRLRQPYVRVQNLYNAVTGFDSWAQWVNQAIGGSSGWVDLTNGGPAVGDLLAFTSPGPRCNHGDWFVTHWQIGNIASSGIGAVTLAYRQDSVSGNAFVQGVGDAKYLPAGFNGPIVGSSFFRVVATGATANITANSGGKSTLTGLTGMSSASVGATLNIRGASSQVNNGAFVITDYISGTSVKVASVFGVAPDSNNGAISWYVTNMTMGFKLMVETPTAGATTVVALGHHSMSVVHYRPPSVTAPLLFVQ